MKTLRKLLTGFLAGMLCLSLIACSGGENAGTDSAGEETAPDTTTADESRPTTPPAPVSLTIAGVPLEQFTIVYADHPYGRSFRNLFTEYDFYKLTAEHIAGEIAAQTGVTLPTARDTKTEETDHEILVGPTNRASSDLFDKMDVYEYTCKVDGGKLIVGGGYNSTSLTGGLKTSYCYASTYHAWDFVKDYIAGHAGETNSVDLDGSFLLSGKRKITTVACIGDSITEGYLSTDWNLNSYPAALQRILWQDYLILNYGNSGKTMRDDLGGRYEGTPQYSAVRRNASKFDMALIMLGTNDSNQDRSWTDADDAAYNRSALELAKVAGKSNKDLKLVIMNCPVYYGSENSGSPRVRWLQAGLVSLLTEAGFDTSFYNMHEYTEQKLGRARFPDLLHPDDRGYFMMAEGLAEMIPACMAGEWVCEPEFPEEGKPLPAPPDVEVPKDSVNLLSKDFSKLYPIESNLYNAWYMGGAPYIFKNAPNLSGSVVTNIEFPVAGCKKGGKFTVSVVKYNFPNLVETLSTHTLTVDFDAGSGWLKFGGLNIEVPEGYTLAFGKPSDTIIPLYIGTAVSGYNFYGVAEKTDNNGAAIAFCVYGKKN